MKQYNNGEEMRKEKKTMYDRGDADAYVIGAGRGTRRRRHVCRRDGVGNMPSAGGSIRHWRLRGSSARTSCTRIRTDGFGLHMSVWTYSREESQSKQDKTERNETKHRLNTTKENKGHHTRPGQNNGRILALKQYNNGEEIRKEKKTMYDRGDADAYIIWAGRGTRRRRDVRRRDGVGNMPSGGGSIRHWRVQGCNP